jgi:uncharacterized integral membrane protein
MRITANPMKVAKALTGIAIAAILFEQMAFTTAAQQHLDWFGGVWLFYLLASMLLAIINGAICITILFAYQAYERWHTRQVFAGAKNAILTNK